MLVQVSHMVKLTLMLLITVATGVVNIYSWRDIFDAYDLSRFKEYRWVRHDHTVTVSTFLLLLVYAEAYDAKHLGGYIDQETWRLVILTELVSIIKMMSSVIWIRLFFSQDLSCAIQIHHECDDLHHDGQLLLLLQTRKSLYLYQPMLLGRLWVRPMITMVSSIFLFKL